GVNFSIDGGSCAAYARCGSETAGPSTIRASLGGAAGTVDVQVAAAALHHLELTPPAATVDAGDPVTFAAEGLDAFGNRRGTVTGGTSFTVPGQPAACEGAVCLVTAEG